MSDFDDLITLLEGVNDPAIFKVVFLAGGPGSGKSFIVGKTALTTFGFRIVNSDAAFEAAMKKIGMAMTPENIFSDEGQSIRNKASALTDRKEALMLQGRLGLVMDGTGKNFEKIKNYSEELKKIGYESAMIFVNTSEATALHRNRQRERSLDDKFVSGAWKQVQANIGKFQSYFGDQFYLIDNNDDSDWKKRTLEVYKKIGAWAKKPPHLPAAKKWIAAQKKARGITEAAPATSITNQSVSLPATKHGKVVVDRRYRKDRHPVLLKKFRKYFS